MAQDIQIRFPGGHVKALMRSMERAQREIGSSLGGAVKMAGYQLARTMGTSVRIAPKYREYRKSFAMKGKRRRLIRGEDGIQQWVVYSYRNGKRVENIRYAKNVSELKTDTMVNIRNRGLAKTTWRAAAMKANISGASVGVAGMGDYAKKAGHRRSEGQGRYSGREPFVRLTNSLNYIHSAMIPGASRDAMRRASSGMEKWIDKKLRQKMKAK